tara:strand:- start:496 stop:687 length:192 start_codon:yes stop_codon:yes gene_type:complete
MVLAAFGRANRVANTRGGLLDEIDDHGFSNSIKELGLGCFGGENVEAVVCRIQQFVKVSVIRG